MSDRKEIIDLTAQDTVTSNDLFPIWSGRNQDTRRVTGAAIAAYVSSLITGGLVPQYEAPSSATPTITITQGSASIWLILTPTGTLTSGTFVLPASGLAALGQEVLVCTSQAVTSVVLSATGLSIVGAPTTLAAGGFFRMRFDSVSKTWFRVG